MNKLLNTILIMTIGCMLYSCDSDTSNTGPDDRAPIILSAAGSGINADVSEKAVPTFPNNEEIAIVAGYYVAGQPTDWKSYSDIDNARATVSSVTTDSVYSFVWDEKKYWPFDNRELVFMAYSPMVNYESVYIDASNSVLLLVLHEDMPDVLYASANDTSAMVAYSKSPTVPVVNLGEFKHVMSQLTVELAADPSMPDNIVVTSLKVNTGVKTATYRLEDADNGLFPTEDEGFIYDIVSSTTSFKNQPISKTVLLYPGTEDVTEVSIELSDGNLISFSRTYLMSFFQNTNPAPLVLERGKNTTLRLTVQGIPAAGGEINLQGVLSGWNERGNFGININ